MYLFVCDQTHAGGKVSLLLVWMIEEEEGCGLGARRDLSRPQRVLLLLRYLKLQVSLHKRACNCRALFRKMAYKDKAS